MPFPIIQKAQWVFVMSTQLVDNTNVSERQNTAALSDQGKHVVIEAHVTSIQAYNMMLDEYGYACWTDMVLSTDHNDVFDTNALKHHNLLKRFGE